MPSSFFEQLIHEIEKRDIVTIFVHQFPDLDCKGSAWGLKGWLKARYPEKTILALTAGDFEGMDKASDEQIQKSTAIVVDTSNKGRIEDPRWEMAEATFRIDHHVPVETICQKEWLDERATAACEMIALMLEAQGQTIPVQAAQALYEGLIADNQRFGITKIRPESFQAAAWLLSMGADVVQADLSAFGTDYESYCYQNKIRSKSIRKSNLLFAVMEAGDYLSLGNSFYFAKEKVDALGKIRGIEIWALFTMMEDGIHYSASLRSRTIPIRDLAVKYGGGGHDCASGIKNLTIAQVQELIAQLEKRSMEPDFVITEELVEIPRTM